MIKSYMLLDCERTKY